MKDWNSLTDFFSFLNENENYVVLRNFEDFFNGCFNVDHPDIDILCSDSNHFLKSICSKSRSKSERDKVHRLICINGKEIAIDVREVGDGYFDTKWEKNMLKSRRIVNDFCYVLSDENYFYSLLYHCLIQKKSLSEDYFNKLCFLAKTVNLDYIKEHSIDYLEKYMRGEGYRYTYPKSSWTQFNIDKVDKTLVSFDLVRFIKRKLIYIYIRIR